MCTILNEVRDTKFHTLVNNLVLRSLAKAKYSEKNLGHYGLALENYAHFTSPIRRYPDLVIHRILTSAITGMGEKKLHTRYDSFVKSAAVSSSACEGRAVKIERDCEDCYKAEFMSMHIGEVFEGEITSVVSHGIYVTLPSTVEGMVSIDNLENGEYYVKENVKVLNLNTKKSYCIGDKVKVKVISANVSKGNVDFIFV
jgi:ribonuclease R